MSTSGTDVADLQEQVSGQRRLEIQAVFIDDARLKILTVVKHRGGCERRVGRKKWKRWRSRRKRILQRRSSVCAAHIDAGDAERRPEYILYERLTRRA